MFFGTGIAHSILLFAVVIASGLWLGKYKIKGISIGSTWILFLGIVLSHFGFRVDPVVLGVLKEVGLIFFGCLAGIVPLVPKVIYEVFNPIHALRLLFLLRR